MRGEQQGITCVGGGRGGGGVHAGVTRCTALTSTLLAGTEAHRQVVLHLWRAGGGTLCQDSLNFTHGLKQQPTHTSKTPGTTPVEHPPTATPTWHLAGCQGWLVPWGWE